MQGGKIQEFGKRNLRLFEDVISWPCAGGRGRGYKGVEWEIWGGMDMRRGWI